KANRVIAVAPTLDVASAQAVAPAVANDLAFPIHVDPSFVYFGDTASHFYRAPRNGGGATLQEITPKAPPPPAAPFAVDDTYVYACGGQQIVRFNKDGSEPSTLLANLGDRANTLIVDATSIYFTTAGRPQGQGPPYGAVWKLAK